MRETLLGLGFAVDVISRERTPLPAAPPLRPLRRGAAELRADRRDAEPRLHQGGASRHRALARQQRRDARPRAGAARPPRRGDRQPQVHRASTGRSRPPTMRRCSATTSTSTATPSPASRCSRCRTPRRSPTPGPRTRTSPRPRGRFLWIGSQGLVHKGLDLVLEAFARMPDLHLTVCGPIREEPAFEAAFRRELYATPNIETLGWVDIASPAFADLLPAHRGAGLSLGRRGLLRHRRQQHAGRADPDRQPRRRRRRRPGLRHGRRRALGRGRRAGGAEPRRASAGRPRGDGAAGLDRRPRHLHRRDATARSSARRSSASSTSTRRPPSPASCGCPAHRRDLGRAARRVSERSPLRCLQLGSRTCLR